MRFVKMAPINEGVREMEEIYGTFDLGLDGLPNSVWEGRNLKVWRPPTEMLQHAYFPTVYLNRIKVNRRIFGPLSRVWEEINTKWTLEGRLAHGLSQFVKCYCFGDGPGPNLFWYGAAWRLSQQVAGEVLTDTIKLFTRHGFTWCGAIDKRRIRDFEMW